jgi:hypothetical protein
MDKRMTIENWWNYAARGNVKVLGEKPIPIPLCLPQIPQGLARDGSRASVVMPTNNRLSHGTAFYFFSMELKPPPSWV